MSIFDNPVYPYHDPLARELHLALAQLYPSARAALHAAARIGIENFHLQAEQSPFFLWKEILDMAAPRGALRRLVELAAQDFPGGTRRRFFDALITGASPALAAEPRDENGAPAFRHGDDSVSEPEALLFHDDLSLPAGRLPALIATLMRLQPLLASVCRLDVDCFGRAGLVNSYGTAFRVGDDLLLSNWHVLHPRGFEVRAITALFGFEEGADGRDMPVRRYACRCDSIVVDERADWGVIRTEPPLPPDIPVISLRDVGFAQVHGAAFVIQHPGGQRKRIAYARNQITYSDEAVVHYLSDTQAGSSGSPVFDESGRLVALHHAGGRPQEVAGQSPLKKNEGIAIRRVAEGLAAAGFAF